MKQTLITIIFLPLLTSPLFGQSEKTGVLYQYKTSSGFVWKTFGKGKVQPKYEGEVSGGAPEGFGVISYPFTEGKSVVGEWKNGKEWNTEHFHKDGKVLGIWVNGEWTLKWGFLCGTRVYETTIWAEKCETGVGNKYEGDIENMQANGQGTYTLHDGKIYVGEFKSGEYYGQGTLTNPNNGNTYTGKWKDGERNGRGTETYSNQDKYAGEFKDGKKHGQGTFTSADGFKYVGKFKDGKKHGQGTLTTPDGNKYVGKFWHGKKHGQGTLTTPDGNKYVGKFYHGEKHGQGTLTSADGLKYVGEFKDGKKHGQGTFTWSDDGKYEGEWKNGKFNGKGTFTFSDGNKGIGEFRENKPWNITTYDKEGNSKWKMVNGVRIEKRMLFEVEKGILFRDTPRSKWEKGGEKWFPSGEEKTQAKYEGAIVAGVPNGRGTLSFPSGSKYVGEFKDGKRTGQGTMIYSNGGKYEGEWKNGEVHGQGTTTFPDGRKGVGEFRVNKEWNVTKYDKDGNIIQKVVNGVEQ